VQKIIGPFEGVKILVDNIVVVENLVKKYKDLVAVNGISFSIRRGEIFALLGPNGAGKTTTIHMISTILMPTSGKVYVNGYDVTKQASSVRKMIGIVFQDPSVDDQLTGYDNMYIHGRLYGLRGKELHEKITRLLEFVELKDFAYKKVRYYSGGMRRRLEIARGLIHEPELLILDEPTIGLDPQTRARIWEYIKELLKEYDMTVLLTTHYMDEAEELASRIAIMDHGKIIAMGTADELKSMLGEEVIYMRIRGDGEKLCNLLDFAKQCRVMDTGSRVELVVENASRVIPQIFQRTITAGVEVREISYKRPTLNDVFLHLTGRELREDLEQPTITTMIRRRMRMR
jgi:ABC-2 type transport system ATP-binding protein